MYRGMNSKRTNRDKTVSKNKRKFLLGQKMTMSAEEVVAEVRKATFSYEISYYKLRFIYLVGGACMWLRTLYGLIGIA